jgi:hypothetical protein
VPAHPVLADSYARDEAVWDALWENRSIGRIAVAVHPDTKRRNLAKELAADLLHEPEVLPAGWTEQWRDTLLDSLAGLLAGMQLPGDWYPALSVPRFVHGQSQGTCDLFGAEVELQPDGLFFVHPLPPDPAIIDAIEPQPLESSIYWGAVEWIRYARAGTGGQFPFRNPVMTSPFDTANYLLGTTVLLEWVYTEPATLRALLEKIMDVEIQMIAALKEASGNSLQGDAVSCMRGGFCFCSECRSLVSRRIYDEFEAPYLRRLGESIGPFAIHSCGSWERTVTSAIDDPNFRAMNGQIRENDLAELCDLAQGRVSLSIGPSRDLDELYTWPDITDFYEHILQTVPRTQPIEISISETDIPLWNKVCQKLDAEHNCLPA